MLFVVFLILMVISAFVNILLKTSQKKDWFISLLISLFLSIIIYALLKG